MRKAFIKFVATGLIYEKDRDGQVIGVKEVRKGSGITKDGSDLYGSIFRQCRQLLPCDSLTVKTYNI